MDSFLDAFRPLSVLADVTDHALDLHSAPARGEVIGPRGPFFAGSKMEALYCAHPSSFFGELAAFTGLAEPLSLIWLVPIAAIEAEFVRSHGWSRFEAVLEQAAPKLLDLRRAPVVNHA